MKFASVLGDLVAIQSPPKYVESLLSVFLNFEARHTCVYPYLNFCLYLGIIFRKQNLVLRLIPLICSASCTETFNISEVIILVWSLFHLSLFFCYSFFLIHACLYQTFLSLSIFANVFPLIFFVPVVWMLQAFRSYFSSSDWTQKREKAIQRKNNNYFITLTTYLMSGCFGSEGREDGRRNSPELFGFSRPFQYTAQ